MNTPDPALTPELMAGARDLSRLKGPSLAEKEAMFTNVLNQLGLTPQCLCGDPIADQGVEVIAIVEQLVDGEAGMNLNQMRFCSRECNDLVGRLAEMKRTATKLVIRSLPAAEWLKGGTHIVEDF